MDFSELLRTNDTIILDGAMGTQLGKRGLMGRGRANLTHPDAVREIHQQYIEAGATLLGGCCGTSPDHIRALSNS